MSRPEAKLTLGLAGLALHLYRSWNVAQIEGTPSPWYGKVAAVVFTNWYSAFKIGKQVPGSENSKLHLAGKILLPSRYTSFQLSKMKTGGVANLETALSLLFPTLYGAYSSRAVLKNKVAEGNPDSFESSSTPAPSSSVYPVSNPLDKLSSQPLQTPPRPAPVVSALPMASLPYATAPRQVAPMPSAMMPAYSVASPVWQPRY